MGGDAYLQIWLLGLLCLVGLNNADNFEHILINKLSNNYEKQVRPVQNYTDPLKVIVGLTIQQLVQIDHMTSSATINGWVYLNWVDYRLQWEPKDYGGIEKLSLPYDSVFIPDVMFYNSREPLTHGAGKIQIGLRYNGDISFIFPETITTSCKIQMEKFPHDSQQCTMKLGSWTHDGSKIDLHLQSDDGPDMSTVMTHNQWSIVKTAVQRNVLVYNCCPEPYVDITYSITISRRAGTLSHVYIAPAVLLSFLIPFTFLLSHTSGEKTTFAGVVLVCYILLIVALTDTGILVSSTPPLLVLYYASCFVLTSITFVISQIIGIVWRCQLKAPPPNFIMGVCTGCFSKVLCVRPEIQVVPSGEVIGKQADTDGQDLDVQLMSSSLTAVTNEWRIVLTVIDRFCFILFEIVSIFMTIGLYINLAF